MVTRQMYRSIAGQGKFAGHRQTFYAMPRNQPMLYGLLVT